MYWNFLTILVLLDPIFCSKVNINEFDFEKMTKDDFLSFLMSFSDGKMMKQKLQPEYSETYAYTTAVRILLFSVF